MDFAIKLLTIIKQKKNEFKEEKTEIVAQQISILNEFPVCCLFTFLVPFDYLFI